MSGSTIQIVHYTEFAYDIFIRTEFTYVGGYFAIAVIVVLNIKPSAKGTLFIVARSENPTQ